MNGHAAQSEPPEATGPHWARAPHGPVLAGLLDVEPLPPKAHAVPLAVVHTSWKYAVFVGVGAVVVDVVAAFLVIVEVTVDVTVGPFVMVLWIEVVV